jgi:hypothetical protein
MPRVRIAPAEPHRDSIESEIAQLRDLDIAMLRKRWQVIFGRPAPPHLPRHLLFRILAYRLQAKILGDSMARTNVCSTPPAPPNKQRIAPFRFGGASLSYDPAPFWAANGGDVSIA